ncbi:MAG: serine/threonine-protein kinase [Gemmataceae bacterium]
MEPKKRNWTPATGQEALDLVRKSQLVTEAQLEPYVQVVVKRAELTAQELLDRLVSDGLLTRFQGRLLGQGRWEGFFLGSYKVMEPLGERGASRVFLAQHTTLQRPVALKILPGKRTNAEQIARFHREARALASLDHPNIVRAYVVDQQADILYMAMEYAEGKDLQRLVDDEGPLEVSRALRLVHAAALGLQHAHDAGWVHRDVKPSNLLLTDRGEVKVLDLGLARLNEDEGDDLTRARGTILGSADYLAPEQAIDSSSVDARADVYSLGATLYFLLTGRPPFDGGCAVQKVARHHSMRPRPLQVVRAGISPEVEALVDRMLSKQMSQRHQSMTELIADVEQLLDLPPAHPNPRKTPSRPVRTVKALLADRVKTQSTPPAAAEKPPVVAAPLPESRVKKPAPSLWQRLLGWLSGRR